MVNLSGNKWAMTVTMEKLNLPASSFKTRITEGKTEIFDVVRKKYVALTPEEWVRQNMIHYLINLKKYPPSLMAVEFSLKLNRMKKRADIIVFNTRGKPVLAVECKSGSVKIDQKVFDQIARYNMALNVKYLVVTNGMEHYICRIDHEKKRFYFIEEIPEYQQLNNG